MAETTQAPPEEMGFSEALDELERIVEALESGQLDLEDALARYERGVALLRSCRRRLGEAEQRITMLMGELEEDETAAEVAAEAEGS